MIYSEKQIKDKIKSKKIGKNLIFLKEVDSTNSYAKKLATECEDGTVIVAESQTSGRGRLDRKFFSESDKGVYISIILKPELPIESVNTITLLSALAVFDAIKELTGKEVLIKWPNDIYLNEKKLCGILTESAVIDNKTSFIIVGIGINLNQNKEDFPKEISEIATSVFAQTGVMIKREDYLVALLKNFEKYYKDFPSNKVEILKKYSENLCYLNEKISVIELDKSYEATLVGIDENGYLLVRTKDKIKKIIGGEISVRSMK